MGRQDDYKEAECCRIVPAVIRRFRDRADDRQTDRQTRPRNPVSRHAEASR